MTRPRFADDFLELFRAAQLDRGSAASRGRIEAGTFFFSGGESQVTLQLFSEIALELFVAKEIARKGAKFRKESHC